MLTYIKVTNINSIDTCEIDFTKDKYKFLEENLIGNYVNPIALYGHNGSGKSSLLKAISYLISLMIDPVDNLAPFIVNNFNLDNFVLENKKGKGNKNDVIGSIELHFSIDGIEYEYFISTSVMRLIEKEFLKSDGVYIFERNTDIENYRGSSSQLGDLRSRLIPSLRYLASEKVNDNAIQNVYKFITGFTFVDLPMQMAGNFVKSKQFSNMSRQDLLVKRSSEVKNILKGYDEFPLYDVVKIDNADPSIRNGYYVKYDGVDGYMPFEMLSTGMLNQSTMLSILVSLPDHSVLFVDELEQALHPSAIISFLKVVKDKKIQLVFSSHNTHILQTLRPDQIYFANWKKGKSTLKKLSKIYPNIREINNIEKMYLSAVFDEAIKNEG